MRRRLMLFCRSAIIFLLRVEARDARMSEILEARLSASCCALALLALQRKPQLPIARPYDFFVLARLAAHFQLNSIPF